MSGTIFRSSESPYCSLYDEGKEGGSGASCAPLQGPRGMLDDSPARYPKFYRRHTLGAFRRMLAGRKTPLPLRVTAEEGYAMVDSSGRSTRRPWQTELGGHSMIRALWFTTGSCSGSS